MTHALSTAVRLSVLCVSLGLASGFTATAAAQTTVFVNELHYDNSGADSGEAIEVAGPAGTDLTGWSIVLYNGNGGASYNSEMLSGVLADDTATGYGFVDIAITGIQNGAPDGLALIDDLGNVVQFLSYEGSFTAVGGPADGLVSIDIGIAESSGTAAGSSLQLMGDGTMYEDFFWGAGGETFCGSNAMQTFAGGAGACGGSPPPPPPPPPPTPGVVFINEIHYDNTGADVGEFVEVAGPTGTSLDGYSLVLYNGNGGASYNTTPLSGTLLDFGDGFGVSATFISGIQNGAPDGIALVDPGGSVVEFLSYEGSFTATSGPATGLTSTDIGVFESGTLPVGLSLQLTGTGTVASDFSWNTPGPETADALNNNQSFGAAPPVYTRIYDIQGNGAASPVVGQIVNVVAVVTGDFQDGDGARGDLNGFYIQEEVGDGDPSTSDGIYVFDGFGPTVDVTVGDVVEISGTVAEFFGETQINAAGSSGSVRPFGRSGIAATDVSLPAAATLTNSDGELIPDLERYEGMLVNVVGHYEVTELFQLDRFGEIVFAEGGRFRQFTQDNLPDPSGFAAHRADIASRTLILDDGDTVQNPDPIIYPGPGLASDNTVRMGDRASQLIGNIRFSRGSGGSGDENYRLEPVSVGGLTPINLREDAPDVGGRIQVASFNVLNYFTTLNERGADNVAEFDRQEEKLVTALAELGADIVGLVELENNYAAPADVAIVRLVEQLNARGAPNCPAGFTFVAPPGMADIGDDAIAVGLIYCTDTVSLAGGTVPSVLDDSDLPALGLTGPVFDGPGTSRAVLAATFAENASSERLTVAVNHFKSKGRSGLSCPTPTADPDCDQGDGAGYWNARRTEAAQALVAWLATDPTESHGDNVVILGDLNAYAKEDPVRFLETSGFRNLIGDDPDEYSFVFDGQLGSLDYAMVSDGLYHGVTGAAEWHSNADEPDALDYNLDFGRNPALFDGSIPYRASDHDPLLLGLELPDTIAPTIACNAPATIRWFRDRNIAFTATAEDALDPDPSVEIVDTSCTRILWRGRVIEGSFCRLDVAGDTIRIVRNGGPRNRIGWTVRATDAAGNVAETECAVDVRFGRH